METPQTDTLKPRTIANAPDAAKPILEKIQKSYGFIPNLMATFANSPAVLEGYLSMDAAWEKGSFSAQERQLILLAASVENRCAYCMAAHSTILKDMMKIDPAVVTAVRSRQTLSDRRQDALVTTVRELVAERGHLSEATRKRFFDQGFSSVQLMEVLIGIALKTVSNYLDHFNPTEIDAAFSANR